MKHHRLAVALLITGAAGCATEVDDVAAIRALGDRWLSAYITADREALAACFTEDAWVMARGRPKLTGRKAIVATLDNRPPGLTIDVEVIEEEINVIGDLAWTVGTFTVTTDDPTDADPPRQSLGRAMLIYRKGARLSAFIS